MKRSKGKYLRKPDQEKTTTRLKTTAIVLSTLAVLLVLAVAGIGYFIWYSGSIHGSMFSSRVNVSATIPKPEATEASGASVSTEPAVSIDADWIDENNTAYNYRDEVISILLMGVDYMSSSRYWDRGTVSNGGNADTLALLILDTKTFDFSILYIPRDTMADLIAMDPEGNYIDTVHDNISTAHSYGDGKELSCRLTVDAVSRLLYGVPVNRYAALDYNALYTLNTLIGGLTITFDQDYTDINRSYTKGSTVTMNSWSMRQFITYRDKSQVSGAYDRGVRNMAVLKALFYQCKDKIAANPTAALDLLNSLEKYITMDLDLSEITFLARNIGKMDFTSDTVVKIPGETVMGESYAEFYPDEAWLHDFVVEKFCVPAE